MARTAKTIGFSVPAELKDEIELMAKQEGRTKSELFREMVRVYRVQRELAELERLAAHGTKQAAARGIRSEAGVERRIHEARPGARELQFIAGDKVGLGARFPLPHLTPQESAALERATSAARAVFGSGLVSITVYGSKVRGDFGPESDIDILVVIREKDWQRIDLFFDVIVAIELDCPVRLSAKIMTRHEYRENKKLRSPFIEEVEREGVAV